MNLKDLELLNRIAQGGDITSADLGHGSVLENHVIASEERKIKEKRYTEYLKMKKEFEE
jgi:hypothetical protein